jgi:preprotein translocase subunit SecG
MNLSTNDWLLLLQAFSLVMATIFILMQNRGAGLSSTFGGSDQVYLTRRGLEKSVVNLTVIFIALFIVLRILSLYIVK